MEGLVSVTNHDLKISSKLLHTTQCGLDWLSISYIWETQSTFLDKIMRIILSIARSVASNRSFLFDRVTSDRTKPLILHLILPTLSRNRLISVVLRYSWTWLWYFSSDNVNCTKASCYSSWLLVYPWSNLPLH